MDGNELWVSDPMNGVATGSPVMSSDGDYIFLTHNSNFGTMGTFTSLWAPGDGSLFYSRTNVTSPFAPLGIYHSPIEGNYDGLEGRNNTNDMIMWSLSPMNNATVINDGDTFGFQFPLGFDGNASEVGYFMLGLNPRTFRAITAPVLTNRGLYAYFSASRSEFYGWNGNLDNARGSFNRGPQEHIGFTRNAAFKGQCVFASPALSSSTDQPFIFGGTASPEFVRMNYNFSQETVVNTSYLIKAEARVDPFDRAVYFVEESGFLHQVNFDTIQDIWTQDMGGMVTGEMALSPKGYVIYVADTSGAVTALQLSDIPVTPSPSAPPSYSPSAGPTAPTAAPINMTASPNNIPAPLSTAAPTTNSTPQPSGPSGSSLVTTSGATHPMLLLSVVSLVLAFLF